ncbi:MAG: SLC13/DASS family transporter [Flavobacteriales bacterium]|nr:SLC13/DASS family transporter [Flavobacteriales bacterium]
MKRLLFQLAGPILALLVFALMRHHGDQPAIMAGLVAWMALWWITEAVPIPITSILPLLLYPLLGIDTVANTASQYGKEIIFLFLGGFILALGIERTGLHRRIALHIVSRLGGSPSRLVLGIMVACALLSMWINSTATTLVMLPIALSLIDDDDAPLAVRRRMTVPLLLGVAYGATIGGMATPVGTPPNLVLLEQWRMLFPDRPAIGFGQWMLVGVPFAVVFLLLGWLVITRWAFVVGTEPLGDADTVRERLAALGRPTKDEMRAGIVFATVALLWMTGDKLAFGESFVFPGWREWTGLRAVTDAAIAVAGAVSLFLIRSSQPSSSSPSSSQSLMDWSFAEQRVPWGILLLIGGGFALAAGVDKAGLSIIIGEGMAGLGSLPMAVLIGAVVLVVCLMSELGSNTATASLVIPILAAMATRWGMDPQSILWPATLGASLGFMLPVASPMQTIVFSTGRVPIRQMVKGGLYMDLIGVVLLMLFFGW